MEAGPGHEACHEGDLTQWTGAIERVARCLRDPRIGNYQFDALPSEATPRTVANGYAAQARLLELFRMEPACWLLGPMNTCMQRIFWVNQPYSARLVASTSIAARRVFAAIPF